MRSGSNYADGKLSNVLYFDTTLSLANIQSLYTDSNLRLPSGVSSSNLLGAWMLNEGTDSTIYNAVGTNNGTITGATWVTGESDIAQTALMRGNEELWLDGTGDYINIPDTNDLSFGDGTDDSAFSIFGWVWMDTADKYLITKGAGSDREYLFGFISTKNSH